MCVVVFLSISLYKILYKGYDVLILWPSLTNAYFMQKRATAETA